MAELVHTHAKPFLRWVGGKTYLLPVIEQLLAGFDCNSYHYLEPMVGGGAVMYAFADRFASITIGDLSPDLINLYRVVQYQLNDLIAELNSGTYFYVHKNESTTRDNYERIRASSPLDSVKQAARLIYLLKTCSNGLMGTNSSGRFNVPPGSYRDPTICDEALLRNYSRLLRPVRILDPADSAEMIKERAHEGTFLYLDPPYHQPGANNGGKFSDYAGEFGEEQQQTLTEAMLNSGASYIYTNRATDFIIEQFAHSDCDLHIIPLKHSIQPKYTTKNNKEDNEQELVACWFRH